MHKKLLLTLLLVSIVIGIGIITAENITINNTYIINNTYNYTYTINNTYYINQTINNTNITYYNITCFNCSYNITANYTNNITIIIYNGTSNLTDFYTKTEINNIFTDKQSQINAITSDLNDNYVKNINNNTNSTASSIPASQTTINWMLGIGIIIAVFLGIVALIRSGG